MPQRARIPQGLDPGLWNEDLAPTTLEQRSWDWKSYAALWIAMTACVPSYMLASGLISEGMAWWQAVLTIFLGNVIILLPMVLIGHAGAKHGVPFPVLLRSAFGTNGAKIPALARGLVACGWFGINCWLGGSAIYAVLNVMTHGALQGSRLPVLGIDFAQFLCFMAFWGLHIYFIRNGTNSIRWLEQLSAPFLITMCVALVIWAYDKAGGFGEMLGAPSQFAPGGAKAGQFWPTFVASLTAMVGFWATMALNITDFTRYARSQRDQMLGQAIGLPGPMALISLVAVVVTAATPRIFGETIWDPIKLATRMGGVGIEFALLAIALATLSTNLAANVVSPAFDISNLAPKRISFKTGGYITAGLGIAMMPWRLMESAGTYLFTWLVGYSALLGPIAGILLADYYLVRRTEFKVEDFFRPAGIYGRNEGWNSAGLGALALGVVPNLPGFLHATKVLAEVPPLFEALYRYAWFVGFAIAAAAYLILARSQRMPISVPSNS
ncbi:MAG: NCS1 family nucleobase:cation symporter-1 [Pseudomonadota bacterium]|nr:NCS1 family nucleobase:cation symporter-1 [Pseudomonadota bacterium]